MTVTGSRPIWRMSGQSRSPTIGRHGSYDGWQFETAFGLVVGLGVGPDDYRLDGDHDGIGCE
jgi:hypothetical protein